MHRFGGLAIPLVPAPVVENNREIDHPPLSQCIAVQEDSSTVECWSPTPKVRGSTPLSPVFFQKKQALH